MNILERIEDIVKNSACYLTEAEILNLLKRRGIHLNPRSFIAYMDILYDTGKVVLDTSNKYRTDVFYVGVDNPKLQKLFNESVMIR